MHTALKVLLMLAVASAAVALNAGSASASAAVEVSSESTREHCGNVSIANHEPSGGCEIDISGTAFIESHNGTSEVVISTCNHSYEANINEEGSGYITHQEFTGTNCGIAACDEAEDGNNPHANHSWSIETAELHVGHAALGVGICLRPGTSSEGQNTPICGLTLEISEPSDHGYRLTADDTPCLEASNTELTGTWTFNAPNIEIIHL